MKERQRPPERDLGALGGSAGRAPPEVSFKKAHRTPQGYDPDGSVSACSALKPNQASSHRPDRFRIKPLFSPLSGPETVHPQFLISTAEGSCDRVPYTRGACAVIRPSVVFESSGCAHLGRPSIRSFSRSSPDLDLPTGRVSLAKPDGGLLHGRGPALRAPSPGPPASPTHASLRLGACGRVSRRDHRRRRAGRLFSQGKILLPFVCPNHSFSPRLQLIRTCSSLRPPPRHLL